MLRPRLSVLAPALLLVASPAWSAPFLTEVAWMGSADNTNDEWVEIYNPGPGALDLSGYELLEGTTVHALPAVSVPEGGVVVLEDSAAATSLAPDAAVVVGLSLNNSGEILRLCPAGQTADPSACDIANGGGAWAAGDNGTKATMARTGPLVEGQPGTWETWAGPDSTVTSSGGTAIKGSPGEGVFEAVDGGPLPDGGGADAGAGGVDAGPPPPFAYDGLAITEIYFNPPTSAETGKEWVEVANLSSSAVALDGAVLERLEGATSPTVAKTATVSGTGIVLEPGERVVFAQAEDLDVGVCVGGPLVVLSSNELQLANSGTQWLRVTANGVSNTVKYAGSGVPSVPEGRALALTSEALDNSDPATFAASGCEYATGAFGSPGVRNEDCALGAVPECPPDIDAGPPPGDDAGPPPVVDAGPNAPPTVTVLAPAAAVTSAGEVELAYSASDPDADDVVEVSLFYDLDGQNNDGVRIASGLSAGDDVRYTWSTEGVPAGTYHVFASARDLRGAVSYAYAAGTVDVGGGAGGDVATVAVVEPDGVNDDTPTGHVLIRWEVALPDDADGTVSLYYDTDDKGLDGEPILAGVPVREATGEDGPRDYLWDPAGVPSGSYTIYAVLDWTRGQASAYSAAINVGGAAGCGCRSPPSGAPLDGALAALGLLGLAALRRRVSRSGTRPASRGPASDGT